MHPDSSTRIIHMKHITKHNTKTINALFCILKTIFVKAVTV